MRLVSIVFPLEAENYERPQSRGKLITNRPALAINNVASRKMISSAQPGGMVNVTYGKAGNSDSSYLPPRNHFFKLLERQSIHDVAGFQPAAPGHRNPVLHISQVPDLV